MSLISFRSGLKLYEGMPPVLKRTVEVMARPVPRKVLLGSGFRKKFHFLMNSDGWSREELESYQLKRLKLLLDHAYKEVPYYHDLFKINGLHPTEITTPGSLKKIPLLTRDTIRKEFSRLTALNSKHYLPGEASTSGTDEIPLRFLLDQQNREIELASVWRHHHWGGLDNLEARMASFGGDFAKDYGPNQKLWRWDATQGELSFNTYKFDRHNIEKMIRRLNKFKPEGIRGYPHCLYTLSKGIEQSKLSLDFIPKLIKSSSEQLPPYMRQSIENAFGAKVIDWYGQSEYVVSIGQCGEGHYHQMMETGIMDVQEDDWGQEKIIGTGLWNFSMPFVNYEVGDIAEVDGGDCPCGRRHKVVRSIEGRLNDYIITAEGKALSGVSIGNYYEKNIIHHLSGYPDYIKVIQESRGAFTIELYRKEGLPEKDLEFIKRSFISLLGKDTDLTIKYLDGLPTEKKWKIVESRLSPQVMNQLLEESLE